LTTKKYYSEKMLQPGVVVANSEVVGLAPQKEWKCFHDIYCAPAIFRHGARHGGHGDFNSIEN
jgi:hypothetical protein